MSEIDGDYAIGTVTSDGGQFAATLRASGAWDCTAGGAPDPARAALLQSIYAHADSSPADGYYGQGILRDLAEQTGGSIEWHNQFGPPDFAPEAGRIH